MLIKEVQTKWGNLYRKRYYIGGKRVSESLANHYFKHHMWEQVESGGNGIKWVSVFNIGPRCDCPSLADHPDLI